MGGRKTSDHRRGHDLAAQGLLGLDRHRAKTLGELLTRLAAKITAYTCPQVFNAMLGRPLRHLASLLVQAIAQQQS